MSGLPEHPKYLLAELPVQHHQRGLIVHLECLRRRLHVKTKVFMMAPVAEPAITVGVEDYIEKGSDGQEAWIVDDASLG